MAEHRTPFGVVPGGLPEVADNVSVILATSVGGEPRVEVFLCRPTLEPDNVDRPEEERELDVVASFWMEPDEFIRQFTAVTQTIRDHRTPPRNGPCPCGSGKKFKHCHGA